MNRLAKKCNAHNSINYCTRVQELSSIVVRVYRRMIGGILVCSKAGRSNFGCCGGLQQLYCSFPLSFQVLSSTVINRSV